MHGVFLKYKTQLWKILSVKNNSIRINPDISHLQELGKQLSVKYLSPPVKNIVTSNILEP